MAQSIVGLQNVQPYKFSECSKSDYIEALKDGKNVCLLNKPNEVRTFKYIIFYKHSNILNAQKMYSNLKTYSS